MNEKKQFRSCRILIVDDERIVREVIRGVFDRPGNYLVDAADGEEAIALVLKEPFDVLIADKNLSGITGLDVIRCAKAVDKDMSTLLITAYASRESAEEAMAIGVDDYIIKPFDLSDIQVKVEEAIDRRLKRLEMSRAIAPPQRHRRVLICEPAEEDRLTLVKGVELLGHSPVVVGKISEVLDAVHRKTVDALICDLELLNSDNATACFLRSTLLVSPELRFVVVAKERGLEGAVDAIHHGAGKVIYRPLRDGTMVAESLVSFLGRFSGELRKPK